MRVLLIYVIIAGQILCGMTLDEKIQMARRAADKASGVEPDLNSGAEPGGSISPQTSGASANIGAEASGGARDGAAGAPARVEKDNREVGLPSQTSLDSRKNPPSGSKKAGGSDKTPYEVNSEDFIDGYYIGRVGDTPEQRKQALESLERAKKLLKAAGRINIAESKMYMIASESDEEGVSKLKYLSKALEQSLFDVFPGDLITGKHKIVVRILPSDAPIKRPVYTDGKFVYADFRAGDISMDDALRALLEAFFIRYGLDVNIQLAPPQWVKDALLWNALENAQLGISLKLARMAAASPYRNIRDIFSSSGNFGADTKAAHAYWLFRAMLKMSDRYTMLSFVENISKKKMTSQEVFDEVKSMLGTPEDRNLDQWIGCVMYSEIYARMGGVDTVKKSRLALLKMSAVKYFEDDKLKIVPFDRLFDSPGLPKSAVQARLDELKFALLKINAVFLNAAVGLGAVYESYLSGNKAAYEAAVDAYITDFDRAKATARAVERAISK